MRAVTKQAEVIFETTGQRKNFLGPKVTEV